MNTRIQGIAMNRRELMRGIVAGSILESLSSPCQVGSNAEPKSSSTPERMIARKGPRLYLTPETMMVLRKQFQTNKEWSQALLANGDAYLARNSSFDSKADRTNAMHGVGQVDVISLTLGLLFHLTGEHKYADALHAALRYFGQYTTWSSPSFLARNPP